MDVKEVREKKAMLESDIFNLISDFEEDSGVHVTDVSLLTTHSLGNSWPETIAVKVTGEL